MFFASQEVLWLLGSVRLFALDFELGLFLVELHELCEIELGLLKELDFADEHVLQRVDLAALLGDFLANSVVDAKDIINK